MYKAFLEIILLALIGRNKYIFKQSNVHHSVHKISMVDAAKPLEAKPREAKPHEAKPREAKPRKAKHIFVHFQ